MEPLEHELRGTGHESRALEGAERVDGSPQAGDGRDPGRVVVGRHAVGHGHAPPLSDVVRNAGKALDFDLLCYSGYPLKTLERRHAKLLARLDAVIPEPYADGLPLGNVWRGSANQPLVPLTERGRARYAEHVDAAPATGGKRMQAAIEGGRVWLIGIPDRGDMAAVESLCASRGLALTQVSWRR